jgi:hypothetical protein
MQIDGVCLASEITYAISDAIAIPYMAAKDVCNS